MIAVIDNRKKHPQINTLIKILEPFGYTLSITKIAGLNSYKISVKERVEKTNAIGITSQVGRYGGTYAHKDIALEFGM